MAGSQGGNGSRCGGGWTGPAEDPGAEAERCGECRAGRHGDCLVGVSYGDEFWQCGCCGEEWGYEQVEEYVLDLEDAAEGFVPLWEAAEEVRRRREEEGEG